jgi:hypothetical protein
LVFTAHHIFCTGTKLSTLESTLQKTKKDILSACYTEQNVDVTEYTALLNSRRYATPKRNLIANIFLHDYYTKKSIYDDYFRSLKGSTISLDHTFKLR